MPITRAAITSYVAEHGEGPAPLELDLANDRDRHEFYRRRLDGVEFEPVEADKAA